MYLDEIEKYFIRKRKKSLIVSPRDWTLIEKWYHLGIPLKIVKQAIDISFESFLSKEENNDRTLNTIKYCEPVIMDLWKEYKESIVGKSATADDTQFNEYEYTIEKLTKLKDEIIKTGNYVKGNFNLPILQLIRGLYKQTTELEQLLKQDKITIQILEERLYLLQQILIKKIFNIIPSQDLQNIKKEADIKLKKYKDKMSALSYEKTFNNLIYKNIRKYYKLPDLSFWS